MFRTPRHVVTELSIAVAFLLVQFAAQFTTRTGFFSALLLRGFSVASPSLWLFGG